MTSAPVSQSVRSSRAASWPACSRLVARRQHRQLLRPDARQVGVRAEHAGERVGEEPQRLVAIRGEVERVEVADE